MCLPLLALGLFSFSSQGRIAGGPQPPGCRHVQGAQAHHRGMYGATWPLFDCQEGSLVGSGYAKHVLARALSKLLSRCRWRSSFPRLSCLVDLCYHFSADAPMRDKGSVPVFARLPCMKAMRSLPFQRSYSGIAHSYSLAFTSLSLSSSLSFSFPPLSLPLSSPDSPPPPPMQALQRLSEPGVTELILPDCSRIEPDQMRDSLLQCRRTLRVLRLGTCGRCVGDATLAALAKDGGAPRLEIASLAGEKGRCLFWLDGCLSRHSLQSMDVL